MNLSSSRMWSAALLIAAAVVARPGAEQRDSGDPVTVEFLALSRAGAPVTNLTAADVVLKVAGRERSILRLQRFQFGEPATSSIAPPFVTNVPPASGIHDTIVVIDDESIVPGDERYVIAAMDQYLAGLDASARVGIVTVQDRGLNLPLTADRIPIRLGIKAIAGRAPSQARADDAPCRTRRVLDALRTTASRFAPGGAPASVLLFTTGLTPPGTAQMSVMGGARSTPASPICEMQPRDYQGLQVALLESAVNLFVIQAALAPSQPMRAGLEMLAGVSGNRLTEVVSGVEGTFSRLANGMRGWYRATYIPEPGERTGQVQRVAVESKREDVRTESRPQVLIPRRVSMTQPKDAKALLRESRAYRDLELRVATYFSQEPGSDKVKVFVLFEPADASDKTTSASVGLYDAAGKLVVQGSADASGLGRSPSILAVLASPGKYRLRVAAVNDHGHVGTIDQDVNVGLIAAGPLKLATLVPGIDEGGFSGRLVFASADTAMAYVVVYGASPAPLTAELVITDSAGVNLGSLPTKILDAPDGSRVIIGGLRLASMAAGDYEMKMIVSLGGQVVGATSHTFHRKSNDPAR